MSDSDAVRMLFDTLNVTREDIARAKQWALANHDDRTEVLVEQWLRGQKSEVDRNAQVDLMSPEAPDRVTHHARCFSVRLAYYQALWELVAAGELFLMEGASVWTAALQYQSGGQAGGLDVRGLTCSFPQRVQRPPLAPAVSADPDVFLKGMNSKSLHTGILEAIEQSLVCFQRGLYMPATAMLAAAAEATWTECGLAVAKCLGHGKLDGIMRDPFSSISKKVAETHKALEVAAAKVILKNAGRSSADVDNADLWTTNLRDRRNALHWGKAKSFVVDHSETASLLMGAPLHIGTLEAIRVVC
jgi:hypothetical protein